jgi:hypothetical protein
VANGSANISGAGIIQGFDQRILVFLRAARSCDASLLQIACKKRSISYQTAIKQRADSGNAKIRREKTRPAVFVVHIVLPDRE